MREACWRRTTGFGPMNMTFHRCNSESKVAKICVLGIAILAACQSTPQGNGGDVSENGGYLPLPPYEVQLSQNASSVQVLDSLAVLDWNTAVSRVHGSGTVSYGLISTGVAGSEYEAVFDYSKSTIILLPLNTTVTNVLQQQESAQPQTSTAMEQAGGNGRVS